MTNVAPAKKGFFEGRKLWFVFAVVLASVTGVLLFIIISQLTATTKYYVLNQDIPARTQITEGMLQEVVTSTGGQPPTAVPLETVLEGDTYAKFALGAGDILTESNTGPLVPITEGVPEGFVTASFTAPASMAVSGTVARGDYIDILSIVTDNTGVQVAAYTLQHVLVLDATIDLDSGDAAVPEETGDGEEGDSGVRAGVPYLYTVTVSQADAAKLALVTQFTAYVVMSADQTSGDPVPFVDSTATIDDLTAGSEDSGIGTDNTFGEDTEKSKKDDSGDSDSSDKNTDGTENSDETGDTGSSEEPVQ